MLKPARCLAIVKDPDNKEGKLGLQFEEDGDFASIPQFGKIWTEADGITPRKKLTYSITKGTNDLTGESKEVLALNLAMTTWDIEIRTILKQVTRFENPDIRIEFRQPEEDELFRDRTNVLAYAFYPGQGAVSGLIVFNDKFFWSLIDTSRIITNPDGSKSNVKVYNVISTMIHETGHGLGLRHAEDCPLCIMHPTYNEQVKLHDVEKLEIRKMYGIRFVDKFFRYFRILRWLDRRHARLELEFG